MTERVGVIGLGLKGSGMANNQFAAGSGAVTALLDAAVPVYVAASESGFGGMDTAALYLQQLAGESGK